VILFSLQRLFHFSWIQQIYHYQRQEPVWTRVMFSIHSVPTSLPRLEVHTVLPEFEYARTVFCLHRDTYPGKHFFNIFQGGCHSQVSLLNNWGSLAEINLLVEWEWSLINSAVCQSTLSLKPHVLAVLCSTVLLSSSSNLCQPAFHPRCKILQQARASRSENLPTRTPYESF
jgi:hypothetical protein